MSGAVKQDIVLSGMRPTGKLHVGHYWGALKNWLALQEDSRYQCYFMVADWHALTTDYEKPEEIEANITEMVRDWLAAGLDPKRSIIFRQSWVRFHAELQLLLSFMTPLSWLERTPTYKEQMQEIKDKDLSTYGFLGYPLLQAADILLYKASRVPVGEDQLPHIEFTREIARRFNYLTKTSLFPEPAALLTKAARVPGIDGRKMSKSYNNGIYLSDTFEEVNAKVKVMYTDPAKIRAHDPGHPEGCVVFAQHQLYTTGEIQQIERDCKSGALTCTDCKRNLMRTLNAALQPFREKRSQIQDSEIHEILEQGSQAAVVVAEKTMKEVRSAMHLTSMEQGERV